MNEQNKLRIWHMPQIPGQPFQVEVETPSQGKKILDILAAYNAFEFDNNLKLNYSDAQGLEIFDGEKWSEWEDGCGNTIRDYELDKSGKLFNSRDHS